MVDVNDLPTFDQLNASTAKPAQPNVLLAGLKTGTVGALANFAGAVSAGGRALGIDHLAIPGTNLELDPSNALASAQRLSTQAEGLGRPDLDQQGFFDKGLGGFTKKLGYELAKMAPTAVGAGVAAAGLAPEAAGVGLLGLAARTAGGAAVTAPLSIGEQYEEAAKHAGPGGPTQADAFRAIGQGLPIGLVNAVAPAFDLGIVGKALEGSIGRRVATSAAVNAAAGGVGSALQTGADTSFDPNVTPGERAQKILAAGAAGAVSGGLIGGLFGLPGRGHTDPANASTDDLAKATESVVPQAPSGSVGGGIDALAQQQRATTQLPEGMRGAPEQLPLDLRMQFGDRHSGFEPTLFDQDGPPALMGDAPTPEELAKMSPAQRRAADARMDAAAAAFTGRVTDRALTGLGGRLPPDIPAAELEAAGIRQDQAGQNVPIQPQEVPNATGLDAVLAQLQESPNAREFPPGATQEQKIALREAQALATRDNAPKGPSQDELYAPEVGAPRGDAGSDVDIRRNVAAEAAKARDRARISALYDGPERRSVPRDGASNEVPATGVDNLPNPDADHVGAVQQAIDEHRGVPAANDKAAVYQQFGDDNGPRTTMRKWLDDADVRNDADLYNRMQDELATKSKVTRSAGFKDMAERIGLLGEDGKPLDLAAERAEAEALPNAGARAAAVANLDAIQDRQNRARAAREPDAASVEAGATPEAASDAAPDLADLQAAARDAALPIPTAGSKTGPALTSKALRARTGNFLESRVHAGTDEVVPKSLADQVVDAAHDMTGGTGGEVSIARLREQFPNLAPKDFENALRDIHTDDSDHTLTQAPKGQRANVDGVTVPGQGRFHNLTVEPRDAVQERSAAQVGEGERPGAVQENGGRDAVEGQTAGAQQDASGDQVAPAPGKAVGRNEAFPGVKEAADRLGVRVPENVTPGERTAFDQRVQLLWNHAGQGKFDTAYGKLWREADEYARRTEGGDEPPREPVTPTGEPVEYMSPIERMLANSRKALEDAKIARDMAQVSTVRQPRTSNQTVAGQAANFMAYRDRLTKGPDIDSVGGTPADLVKALQEPKDTIPPTDATIVKPLVGEVSGQPTLDRATAETAFKDATANIRPDIMKNVKLIHGKDELPANLVAQAAKQGLNLDEAPGLYHQDTVYIRGDQVRSPAEIQQLISHEVIGHLVTEARTGDKYVDTLSSMYDRVGGTDRLFGLFKKAGLDREYLDRYPTIKAALDGETLTGQQKANVVDELLSHYEQSGGDTSSGMTRAALAFLGRMKQAIAATLRRGGLDSFADRFERYGVADMEAWLQDNRNYAEGKQPENTIDLSQIPDARLNMLLGANKQYLMPSLRRARDSVQNQNDDVRGIARMVGVIRDAYNEKSPVDIERAYNTVVNSIKTTQDLVRSYDGPQMFGGLLERKSDEGRLSENIISRVGQFKKQYQVQLSMLRRADRNAYNDFAQVVQLASVNNIDPTRPFSEHTWLQGERPEEAARLSDLHADLSKTYQRLGQLQKNGNSLRVQELYKDMQDGLRADQLLHHTNALYAIAKATGLDVPGFESNPVRDFSGDAVRATGAHDNPEIAAQVAKSGLDRLMQGARQFVTEARADKTADQGLVDTLKSTLDRIDGSLTKLDQGPYTHLGRSGDFFAKFGLKKDETGNPTPEALKAVSDLASRLKMDDLQFQSTNNNNVFVRFENAQHARAFREGLEEIKDDHLDNQEPIRSGSLLDGGDWQAKEVAPELAKLISKFEERTTLPDNVRQQLIREVRGAYLDALPGDSAVKLQSQRMNVNGWSGDILKNQTFRDTVSANAIGRMATTAERADLSAQIIKKARDAQDGDFDHSVKMADAAKAVLDRDAAQSSRVSTGFWDKLRAGAHGYYLGMSPGYFVMQLAQTYTLTLPEIAQHFGYANTVGHMASALNDTRVMMTAMAKVQREVYSAWKHGEATNLISGISDRALEIAKDMGMSQDKIDFIRTLDNMGKMEMGTFAKESFGNLQAGARSSVLGKTLQMANSTATISELTARMISAFAAKRAYETAETNGKLPSVLKNKFEDIHDYAGHVVSESMFEWGNNETSRLFAKGGPLGPIGPVALQFHGFGTRMYNMLTNRLYEAFKGDTPEDQAAARKYLAGHLAAVTTLAGTLGLPIASWAAAAATKASALGPGGEAYDVESHYKSFLASVFGKELGSVISNGVPRYFNLDFSDLGDKDLLPLTSLLEDRRKAEESIPDYLSKAWGSSIGIGVNGVLGVRDMMNGQVMNGLARILPTAMRNGVRAYQLSDKGYVDSKGNKLPMEAGALDVLRQALGIQGGDITEYREKSRAVTGAAEDRAFHAGIIKKNIAMALESGDTEGQERWMDAAREYDADPNHRGMPITPSIPAYIASRARARAYGAAHPGVPLNVTQKDLPALSLFGSF